jgi:hypothetical protein
VTSLTRGLVESAPRHLRKALALLAFAVGISGGVGLYVGTDDYYLRISSHVTPGQAVEPLNGNPQLPLKTVSIPTASLQPALAHMVGRGTFSIIGRSIDYPSNIEGYVFRNAWNTSTQICLGAENSGTRAGENGDPVRAYPCSKLTPNDIWIPAQWEENGEKFTWLVNLQYQSKCLNVRNLGGLGNGQPTMLWSCYEAPNESWDFGDWLHNMQSGINPYPLFLASRNFCLDADKFEIPISGKMSGGIGVNLWTYYPTSNQYWF